MMFQNYALYPHMTGAENMKFGMRSGTDFSTEEIDRRVEDAGETPDITELLETNIPRSDTIIINNAAEMYDKTIKYCLEHDCSVAITQAGVTIHKTDSVGIVDTLRDVKQLNTEYSGGRPPIGTCVENGQLVRADNYRNVCKTLTLVAEDKISKQKAATRLDCTRRTVSNALQRRDLYNIK
jgi:hypothetical protein